MGILKGEDKYVNEHNHPHNNAVINRLSRLIWHLESIKRMTEEGLNNVIDKFMK